VAFATSSQANVKVVLSISSSELTTRTPLARGAGFVLQAKTHPPCLGGFSYPHKIGGKPQNFRIY
jgi:hypothetical protein